MILYCMNIKISAGAEQCMSYVVNITLLCVITTLEVILHLSDK